jgi:hypothetical protein
MQDDRSEEIERKHAAENAATAIKLADKRRHYCDWHRYYVCGAFCFEVNIYRRRIVSGAEEYHITPVTGSGVQWVRADDSRLSRIPI